MSEAIVHRVSREVKRFDTNELSDSMLNDALDLEHDHDEFDVIIKSIPGTDNDGQQEILFTSAERQNLTLGKAIAQLTSMSGNREGQKFIIDITTAHVGANQLPKPQVVVSSSLAQNIKSICQIATNTVGGVEIPWILLGQTRDNVIYLTRSAILPATCTSVSFHVESRDLSATSGEMAHKFKDLQLLGIAHRHPGTMAPRPSGTDDVDFKAMTNLLYALNLQSSMKERQINGTLTEDGVINYTPFKDLSCAVKLNNSNAEQTNASLPKLVWQEKWQTAFFAGVIFNCDGDLPFCEIDATHLGPYGNKKIRYKNAGYTVQDDSEVAKMLEISLQEVQFTSDIDAITNEVKNKLKPVHYSPYYQNTGQFQQPPYNTNYGGYQATYGANYRSSLLPANPTPQQLLAALKDVENVIRTTYNMAARRKSSARPKFMTQPNLTNAKNLLFDIYTKLGY
ncbi:hypothetical protein TI05_06365 [Achromatium sp. WMS3]|nr:hypothetical protein TI05_06365 [Achromatium sp. WMS3]